MRRGRVWRSPGKGRQKSGEEAAGRGEEEELKEHVQKVRRGLQSADGKRTGFWPWFGNSQVWL